MDIVDLKQDPNATNTDPAPNQGAHLTSMDSDELNDNENNTTPNISFNTIKEEEDPEDEWKQEEFSNLKSDIADDVERVSRLEHELQNLEWLDTDDIIIEQSSPSPPPSNANIRRSARSNAGQGVNRLFMDPSNKAYNPYKTKQMLMKNHVLAKNIHNHNVKTNNFRAIATNVMFTQMSAKKGIQMFGE